MGGDYTRWTFDPTKDYKGVLKQQGRVDLDADWNELVEIIDRRWRTETIDIAGQDFVGATTPDAFLITPVGVNDFSIGIGRLYIDGLVAECHGVPPAKFDPILGEIKETNPVHYSQQPYFPDAPSPLLPPIGGPNAVNITDLIYLDVWEREVTAIQDPNIREKALAGPDTCTRLQTVWQVKDLPNVGAVGCGDVIRDWNTLVAPSAGRLTTSTIPPNPSATPCILSQTGGYTGLENRLYRVEIHTQGPMGTAQFKWSRDNVSVVAAVTAISASGGTNTLLNVTTLGRDSVLRFNAGDWVEVLDDNCEFLGVAGHLAKIVAPPDIANLTLTINPPIPAGFGDFNPGDPGRHTRVRRWDGRADLNSDVNAATGLIAVSAGPIDLEDGIQVSFSDDPVGGNFKAGDYWIFAARTFDASVEPLINAPPRGILHHYCRLALITWTATGGTFSDCRPTGHKCTCGGDCSATVGDGVNSVGQFTDIQAAINSLGPAGGVVCVGRGVYQVTQTITIGPQNGPVTLLGMGAATRIVFTPGQNSPSVLLGISETDHIRVEGFFMAAASASALIQLTACCFCVIRECTLVNLAIAPATAFTSFSGTPSTSGSSAAIVLSGKCVKCDIKENALLASKGILGTTVQDLCIRDNDFLTFHGAVFLQSSNGLEVTYNLMRGISQSSLKELQGSAGGSLAGSINAFQKAVTKAFAGPSGSQFMGTGLFLLVGFDVNVSHNRIVAQAAVVTVLVVEGTFETNEILAIIGFISLFAIDVRVANSLIAGLLIGYAQIGIVIDIVCEANLFLGFVGVAFLPFSDFLTSAGATLSAGLASSKIAGNAGSVFAGAQKAGVSAVGALKSFGLAATVKIHRNDFFTFLYGIAKLGQFLSADFSIIGNTFALCRIAAISLSSQLGTLLGSPFSSGGTSLSAGLAGFFPLRHLVQSNSMSVTGIGVRSACAETQVRDNTISVTSVGVSLFAPFCDVQNNMILGNPSQNLPATALIELQLRARVARVRGNRLLGGPGNGVSLASRSDSVAIEDNEIIGMAQNGITSVDGVSLLPRLSVSRNSISGCSGGAAGGTFWHAGAIVVADVTDAQIIDNKINGNSTPPAAVGAHAIYAGYAIGGDLSRNQIFDNFTTAPVAGNATGAILVLVSQGEILVHGNRLRSNGGLGIAVLNLDTSGSVSIQHNHADNSNASATNPALFLVIAFSTGFIHIEDNMCFLTLGPNSILGIGVLTFALHTIANGNTIQVAPPKQGLIRALVCDGVAGPTESAIVTSNTAIGGLFSNVPGAVIANNVII
jgi:hypothetical protein